MCRALLDHLDNSEGSRFRGLKPTLKIQGSILEGTRVGQADELDLSLTLEALTPKDVFLTSSATLVKVNLDSDQDPVAYGDLLKFILEDLAEGFERISLALPRTIELGVPNANFTPCPKCLAVGTQEDLPCFTHCQDCLPPVTMTRMGPCLLFKRDGILISIDIIPGLPHQVTNPLEIHHMVTKTLVQETPENWLPHLRKYLSKDRILPEALISPFTAHQKPLSCKVLHFDHSPEGDNFILRAGQVLDMEQLENPLKKYSFSHG